MQSRNPNVCAPAAPLASDSATTDRATASLQSISYSGTSVYPDFHSFQPSFLHSPSKMNSGTTDTSSSVSPPSVAGINDSHLHMVSDDKPHPPSMNNCDVRSMATAAAATAAGYQIPGMPYPIPVSYAAITPHVSMPTVNLGLGKLLAQQCHQSTTQTGISSLHTESSSSVPRADDNGVAAVAAPPSLTSAVLNSRSMGVPIPMNYPPPYYTIQGGGTNGHPYSFAAIGHHPPAMSVPDPLSQFAVHSAPSNVSNGIPSVSAVNGNSIVSRITPPPPIFDLNPIQSTLPAVPTLPIPATTAEERKPKSSSKKKSKQSKKRSTKKDESSKSKSHRKKKKSSHSPESSSSKKSSSKKHSNNSSKEKKKRSKSKKPNMKGPSGNSSTVKAAAKGGFTAEMSAPTKFDKSGSAMVNVKLSRLLGYEDLSQNDYSPLKQCESGSKDTLSDPEEATVAADCLKSIRKRKKEESQCGCLFRITENGLPKRCGLADACENRICKMECPPDCPNGRFCENQSIRRRQWQSTYVSTTPGKGRGLFAAQDIDKDSLVIEYLGEIITEKEGTRRRLKDHDRYGGHFYMLQLERGLLVDATLKGCPARFMNHSCMPNCITRKWNVSGEVRIGLYALRDIDEGEELTFDYQFESFGAADSHPCHCGAPNCRKFLGAQPVKLKADSSGSSPKRSRKTSVRFRKHFLYKVTNEDTARMIQAKQARDVLRMIQSDEPMARLMSAYADTVCEGCVSREPRLCKDILIRALKLRKRKYGKGKKECGDDDSSAQVNDDVSVHPSDSSVSTSSSLTMGHQSSSDVSSPASSTTHSTSNGGSKKRKRKEMQDSCSLSHCDSSESLKFRLADRRHSSADVQSVIRSAKPKKKKRRPKVSNSAMSGTSQSCPSSMSPVSIADESSLTPHKSSQKSTLRPRKPRCYSEIIKERQSRNQ